MPNFLKPYNQKELNYERKVFNYRLSRGRNVIENAFGILSSRFRIFHTPIGDLDMIYYCHIALYSKIVLVVIDI